MSIIFSKQCEYAIQAILYISSCQLDSSIQQREISDNLNIPYSFLGKILQQLTHHNILISRKGKNGGFQLKRSASKIRLIEVVNAIDGSNFLTHCVIGLNGCADKNPCPLHKRWNKIKKEIQGMLETESVREFGLELSTKLNRIRKKIS